MKEKREKKTPIEHAKDSMEENKGLLDSIAESDKEVQDPVTLILNEIKKLAEKQEKFELETIKMVDKQTDRLTSLTNDLKNTPQQDFTMPPMPVQQQQQSEMKMDGEGNYIDDKGVSWGKSIPSHLQGKKDEFNKGNPNQIGNMQQYIPYVMQLLTAYIQKPQQGQMGQIFTEFIMRDFFENYQQTKLMQKANLNVLVKKGLLSEEDVAVTTKNSDVLNDPLNKMIDSMKQPKPE